MPYTTPPAKIKGLPEAAQKIWVAAFNAAYKEYKGDEAKTNATAWAAVKKAGYKQSGDKWIKATEAKDILYQFPVQLSDFSATRKLNLANLRFRKQLLRYGKWLYEGAKEGVLEITPDIIKQIVANFRERTLENVPVTDDHSEKPSDIVGQVVDLVPTENGLDAIYEIPEEEPLAKKIANGIIKGTSASIEPDYIDKETGEDKGWVLWHAAIVNEPYLKGMSAFQQLAENENKLVINLKDMKEKKESEVKETEVKVEPEKETKTEETKPSDKPETELKEDKLKSSKPSESEVKPGDDGKEPDGEDNGDGGDGEDTTSDIQKVLEEVEKCVGDAKDALEEVFKILGELKGFDLSDLKKRVSNLELSEVDDKVNQLIRDKKIMPSQKDEVKKLLSHKNDKVDLGEGKSTTVGEQLEKFFAKTKIGLDEEEKGSIGQAGAKDSGVGVAPNMGGHTMSEEFMKEMDIDPVDQEKFGGVKSINPIDILKNKRK